MSRSGSRALQRKAPPRYQQCEQRIRTATVMPTERWPPAPPPASRPRPIHMHFHKTDITYAPTYRQESEDGVIVGIVAVALAVFFFKR